MSENKVTQLFASNVFSDSVMRERLPKETYKSLKRTIEQGLALDPGVAQVVANAMKDWAVEKGATHYTHWFQPMTSITAEKHDAFIAPSDGGKVILEFSGKALIKGEPDASSFPSGGLRNTFEARGYTAWDPTSNAFIKDGTLYIPTAFCSYTGEVLDKKTPLLRSMEVMNKHALRVLKLFGNSATHVTTTVGSEQEYFLIDRELYNQRKDLIFTGRTLFGAKPPKGQELEDHYFGTIKERVSAYMKELDEELWKLGIYAKTEHNEVAPAQHELAPIFTTSNVACDHNQLMMEMMKKIAAHHGLVCLLHEKPFAGVNGSGKHNNWSISTDKGENLLKPGKNPAENKQFLLFLAAVIKAVDQYGDMIRVAVASAGNDHRLGANEAPPAIVSIYLGDELTNILKCIETGSGSACAEVRSMNLGVASTPVFKRDTTDRNRTSPFAFTGDKFELRMVGSSHSIAGANIVLNTIVADALSEFADRLEAAKDIDAEIMAIIKETATNHKRIIFNGNNYAEEWVAEAEKRGLPNYRTTVEALPAYIKDKNVELFVKHGIFTTTEVHSRYEIKMEAYCKTINIEALTMLEMAKREILPACIEYSDTVFGALATKKASGLPLNLAKEEAAAVRLSNLINSLIEKTEALEVALDETVKEEEILLLATSYKDKVIPAMNELRGVADELETIVSREYWPFPTYSDLLFNI